MAFKKHSTSEFKPTSNFTRWDQVGKAVEGKWVRVQNSPFKDKDGNARIEVVFTDKEGEERTFPVLTAMENYFEAIFGGIWNVPAGAEFRITFTGYQPIKGQPQPMKTFDIEFDESVIPSDEIGI